MAKLLGSKPDFVQQADNPSIKEVVESLGQRLTGVSFSPKFHCELDIIEYLWWLS